MPLVTPTPIPAYPAAPLVTDDRVTFSAKAFALASAYEPQRVSFNLAATQTNTNAAYAHERANASAQSAADASGFALTASQKADEADAAVVDVRAALAAIQAGPVASVMGRTGVVTGLVEQAATLLAANTNLDTVVKSGFYRIGGAATLGGVDVSLGQLIVSTSGAGSIFQIAAHYTNGNVVCRGGDLGGSFAPWQRVLTDRVLAERLFGTAINASAYTVALSNGSIQQFTLNTSTTITMPAKRQDGDQCTFLLYQNASASVAFSANVRLPKGISFPSIVAGELLTVSMIAMNDVWYAYIGAKHSL